MVSIIIILLYPIIRIILRMRDLSKRKIYWTILKSSNIILTMTWRFLFSDLYVFL